ncbi:MAG: hypothetical protein H6696_04030 [Deferribacteres bacterium]|nr:hypothetical protein [candidate division KSB1 bacterium]MCB9501082.1 hypothetical protein [Deferribacteres bacterium]
MPALSQVEVSKPDSRSTGRFDRRSDRFTLHFHTAWTCKPNPLIKDYSSVQKF